MMISETAGFSAFNTDKPAIPLLLSVPHAGREYPDIIFDHLRLAPENLLRLEDRYADLLAREAISNGVPTIIASRARAWIDLNREESDVDVAMVSGIDSAAHSRSQPLSRPLPSAKQRGGLGLIPRRLSGAGEIWKKPITVQELDHRIISHHRPYHAQIEQILQSMRDQFGCALLLDLHSMPPIGAVAAAPRFVVGDLFGRSAAAPFADLAASYLRAQGFVAALNYPYSGDYILRRHGDSSRNIHALQLEVDRSLYLDATLTEPAAAVSKIAHIVAELVRLLVDAAARHDMLIAAE